MRLLLVLLLFVSTLSQAQSSKIYGYLPSYRLPSDVQYNKISDLIYAFINPSNTGTVNTSIISNPLYSFDMNRFNLVKQEVVDHGVNLWIALGGIDGGLEVRSGRLNAVSGDDTYRGNLVSSLVDFANNNNCYGLVVDWEYPKTAEAIANHLKLIQDLRTYILTSSNANLKIAVSIGGEYKNGDNHLSYLDPSFFSNNDYLVDEWHLWALDFPSSYNVNHSSYTDTEASLSAWNSSGIPYERIVLGIPFYARNADRTLEHTYSDLTGNPAVNYNLDEAAGFYYNGTTTIRKKIDLARSKCLSGTFIWELGQDRVLGNYSLLDDMYLYTSGAACPVPALDFGDDKNLFGGLAILDPKVSTAIGRTFTWKKGNDILIEKSTTASTLEVTGPGIYKVEIIEDCCMRSAQVEVKKVTGIWNRSDSDLIVYPNPFTSELNVEAKEGTKVMVYNLSGQLIYSEIIIKQKVILGTDFGKGVYIIEILSGEGLQKVKVVKE